MDQWSGASSLPLESTQPAFQFNSIQLDAPLFGGMFFSPPVKNNPKRDFSQKTYAGKDAHSRFLRSIAREKCLRFFTRRKKSESFDDLI